MVTCNILFQQKKTFVLIQKYSSMFLLQRVIEKPIHHIVDIIYLLGPSISPQRFINKVFFYIHKLVVILVTLLNPNFVDVDFQAFQSFVIFSSPS